MKVSPLAGTPATPEMLIDVAAPYPTQAAAIQQAAEAYLRTRPPPSLRARVRRRRER